MPRPYVVVNLAMSADGKLSTRERRQVKISGKEDFSRVDQLKAESDAVMVGIGTVLADDPSLTVKSPELIAARRARGLADHPVRIVVDCRARTPPGSSVLLKGQGARVVACCRDADAERCRTLSEVASVIRVGQGEVDLEELLSEIYRMGIRRLMVEGGGRLIGGLFSRGLVDEFITFIGNIVIGGETAPTPADGPGFVREEEFPRLSLFSVERMDQGVLLRWMVEKNTPE
ncbi:MAG: 2,5-diamino-6-ribosylamino-4(3H)-pyrimidinone 5'-phosphate reductase [Methanoregulaceae archaeon PtaB.Bin056]|jgi:2,5-diamino-6-(ribosylamino)-4(3H)-pyrimidinone 5'-phosphate reductase|nr:MAG: 2,5-diamino-6-ribosylamino-4(3H)-pyrimidinone 5'-phosphate reductase [Methanoregulaceae archaeon PtaB.Bin056]